MTALSFPLFVTFGAGLPTITGETQSGPGTNDIANAVAAGASGIRFGIIWDAANPSFDGVTLNSSYMARIKAVVQYCNTRTLLTNTVPANGNPPGLAVDLQAALGATFNGQGFNEHANGGTMNVPKKLATFAATIADYFKPVGGTYHNGQLWSMELGNEPNHCLPAGAQIETERGPRPIIEIGPGDRVWSWVGPAFQLQTVVKAGRTGTLPVLTIEMKDAILRCTADHRVLLVGGEWVRAGDLHPNDVLVAHQSQYGGTVETVTMGATSVPVYDLEIDGEPNFVADGVVVHNSKWDLKTNGSNVLGSRGEWLAAGSPADGYKALSYVKCMARFYGPAKAANPALICVMGGLGGHADSPDDTPVWTFTQDMYDSRFTTGGYDGYQAPTGIHGLIDQFNAHPYCYPITPTADLALAAGAGSTATAALTTVAAGSNGVNTNTFTGTQTLQTASLASAPSYGVVQVATAGTKALILYTAKSGNNLLNCETLSGGGTLATGGAIRTYTDTSPATARGWYQFAALVRPIISAGGGHSDALDPTLPVLITEFGTPAPVDSHAGGTSSVQNAADCLTSACTEWESYPWGGGLGGPLSYFCLQDKDETGLAASAKKYRWYGLYGTGTGQWEGGGDTVVYGQKQPLWQTYHDIATQGGGTNRPTIATVNPTGGPPAGGTAVTITGTRLSNVNAVAFGTVPATSVVAVSGTSVTCVSPAGAGTVDVTVTTSTGKTSATSSADLYAYTPAGGSPTVTGLSPSTGVAAGGTSVTITGTNFTGTTAVKFGGTPATAFSVTNSTTIAATSPAGSGNARVAVTNATGTSVANPPGSTFTYTAPASGLGWGLNISPTYGSATAVANLAKGLFTSASSTDERLVRVQPEWGYAQGSFAGTTAGQNDTFVWDRIDPIIDAHSAAGNKVLFIIGYTPAGLQQTLNPPRGDKCFPKRDAANGYRDVANYAWAVADRFETRAPGTLRAIEVWNEPSGTFLYPISVANYTAMLVAVYEAVKNGNIADRTDNPRTTYSNILIGTAGISPETPGTANAVDQWHQGIIDNGGTNSFDFVCHHPYGLMCPPTNAAGWNQRKHGLPELRVVLDGANRTDAEIWLTEDGCFNRPDSTATNTADTNNCGTLGSGADPLNKEITESETGTRIAELLTWWNDKRSTYKLGRLLYYQLEDANTNANPGDWANHAGIYPKSAAHDGTAKSAISSAFITALGGAVARTAPTISITTPPDDPTHVSPLAGTATFIFDVADTVDADDQLTVQLYRGNGATLVATLDAATNYSILSGWFYLFDTTALADGNYVFAGKATNTAGQTTLGNQPNGIRVAINNGGVGNSAPAVNATVTIITSSGTFTLPTANPLVVSGTITIECVVTDDHDSTVTIDLFDAGAPLGTMTPKPGVPNTYHLTVDTTGLANGIGSLTLTATDSGGLVTNFP